MILGTGIAGLTAALKAAQFTQVLLIAKDEAMEGSTRYAQGGIASVWSKKDRFEDHQTDTLRAGAGLCDEEVVRICVEEGPDRVRELIGWGVPFTKSHGDPTEAFDLHREGGHSSRRILHADDLTGLAIQKALLQRISENPKIELLEHHIAIDLICEDGRCAGAYVLDSQTNRVKTLSSQATVLATGGMGKAYLYTSNPDIATGDGLAMAARAGAQVANLEFMQFHPTCLFHPEAKNFLISEALRGEGAVLKSIGGQEFLSHYHEMGSLAPRDVVARAIDQEMKRSGAPHVCLDATSLGSENLKRRFPNIYDVCHRFGVDIDQEPIPVVPAAHYMCGGVSVDQYAQTSVPGLYAIGEVACTGVHGANRLASNSLLEAAVFAHRACESIRQGLAGPGKLKLKTPRVLPEWDSGSAVQIEEQIDITSLWHEVRTVMWNYVGIVRSNRRLERAKRRLKVIRKDINRDYWAYLLTRDLIELRNLILVAELIVESAMHRKESRGLHYTVDYPWSDPKFEGKPTLLRNR